MDPEVPVVVLELPKEVAPRPPTEPAFVPKFDWVVGCKLAELPEFYCPPPPPRGANAMFGFVLLMFLPVIGFGTPEPLVLVSTVEVVIVPVVLEDRSVADATGVVAATGVPPGVVVFVLTFAAAATAVAALEKTKVFLIALSYHSKVANGAAGPGTKRARNSDFWFLFLGPPMEAEF
jgi:hypothetical protein